LPLALRLAALGWGLVEFFGYAYSMASLDAPLFAAYGVTPAVALVLSALIPNAWLKERGVKLVLVALLAAATLRRLHSISQELLDSPPYLLAVSLQAVSLVILVFIAFYLLRANP
jgi:hypothetical protein